MSSTPVRTIAGVIMVVAAAATARAQGPMHDHSAQPAISPSAAGVMDAAVARDIARLNRATERFKSAAEAVRAGYPAVAQCVAHPTEGAMGLHYTSPSLSDATLDVERPEVLVYEKMADGALRLNGVEYLVPISAWSSPEPPHIFGQDLKRADSLGIWYLHVWNWTSNPSGLFADWNPNVKCR